MGSLKSRPVKSWGIMRSFRFCRHCAAYKLPLRLWRPVWLCSCALQFADNVRHGTLDLVGGCVVARVNAVDKRFALSGYVLALGEAGQLLLHVAQQHHNLRRGNGFAFNVS